MALDGTDVRLLRLFMTIVESGGFAAAQGELNLSLSTISAHVSTLETRLGVRLCRRGRSGFALTDAGRAVYEEARRLTASIENFEGRVRSLRGSLTGQLSVGLVDNTITDPNAPLDRVFAAFTGAAPEVMLSLSSRPPNELLQGVIAGQLQVAIASFAKIVLGLSYIDLYEETQRFYCGAGHPLFAVPDGEVDIDAVRRHRIVGRSYWGQRDLKIFAVGGAKAVVNDMESEARLILSGAYLGYLPEHFARRYVAEGRLRALRPDLFDYAAPFQLAHAPDKLAEPITRLFVDTVRRIMPAATRPSRKGGTVALHNG